MLFGSSDGVGGYNGPTRTDTHLRTCALGTILANTYSLLLVVPDVPSRNRGDRTKMNSTKTDNPSVSSLRRSEPGGMTHRLRFLRTKYTRPNPGVSDKDRRPSEKELTSSDSVRK